MSKEIMLALPEVAYLVERVPVSRVVLKPNAIHLRFCQHARDSNMPLKEQCRILGIPWHARKITAPVATKTSLDAARITAASVFAQAYPVTDADARHWSALVVETKAWPDAVRHWLAFNLLAVRDEWELVKTYLTTGPALGNGIVAKTVVERAKEHKKRVDEAAQRRREEMNMWDWDGMDARRAYDMLRNQNPYQNAALQAHATEEMRYQMEVMRQYQNQGLGWGGGLAGLGGGQQQRRAAVEDRSPIAYEAKLLAPFIYGDFTVQLLNTHEQFRDEGERMHHCVETYFPRAKHGACRIVSLTNRQRKIATAEFTADWELVQVKGPTNQRIDHGAPIEALRAYGRRQVAPAAAEAPAQLAAPEPEGIVDSSAWTGIKRALGI